MYSHGFPVILARRASRNNCTERPVQHAGGRCKPLPCELAMKPTNRFKEAAMTGQLCHMCTTRGQPVQRTVRFEMTWLARGHMHAPPAQSNRSAYLRCHLTFLFFCLGPWPRAFI